MQRNIKYFGIIISENLNEICRDNWILAMNAVKAQLLYWEKLKLSWLGCITSVNVSSVFFVYIPKYVGKYPVKDTGARPLFILKQEVHVMGSLSIRCIEILYHCPVLDLLLFSLLLLVCCWL